MVPVLPYLVDVVRYSDYMSMNALSRGSVMTDFEGRMMIFDVIAPVRGYRDSADVVDAQVGLRSPMTSARVHETMAEVMMPRWLSKNTKKFIFPSKH
jgi:hypothetical protein